MGEGQLAQFMRLELPKVGQVRPDAVTHRPIVVFSLDRVFERLPLRVALNTGVIRLHIVHPCGIDDGVPSRMFDMDRSCAMTALAGDVPFSHAVVLDVETDRMAAVT